MAHYKYDCTLCTPSHRRYYSIYIKVENSSESEMQKEAMLEEMNSLHKNDTWKLSALPNGDSCKWVYAKK